MLASGESSATMGLCVLRFSPPAAQQSFLRSPIGVAVAGPAASQAASQPCTLQAGPTRSVIARHRCRDGAARRQSGGAARRRAGAALARSQPWRAALAPEEEATAALRASCSDAPCRSLRRAARPTATAASWRTFSSNGMASACGCRANCSPAGTRASTACPAATPACASCWRTSASRAMPRTGCGANAAYAVRAAQTHARAHAPAQFVRDRRRHRRQGRGDESADLHQLRRRLAQRLHGRHRGARAARQPGMGQDAHLARGKARRGARLDPISQRALHRHRGPEPDRACRRDAARSLGRRRPAR